MRLLFHDRFFQREEGGNQRARSKYNFSTLYQRRSRENALWCNQGRRRIWRNRCWIGIHAMDWSCPQPPGLPI